MKMLDEDAWTDARRVVAEQGYFGGKPASRQLDPGEVVYLSATGMLAMLDLYVTGERDLVYHSFPQDYLVPQVTAADAQELYERPPAHDPIVIDTAVQAQMNVVRGFDKIWANPFIAQNCPRIPGETFAADISLVALIAQVAGRTVGYHVARAYPSEPRIAWGQHLLIAADSGISKTQYRSIEMYLVLEMFHQLAAEGYGGYVCILADEKLRSLAVDDGPVGIFESIPRAFKSRGFPTV
jgi:hypothetical protein